MVRQEKMTLVSALVKVRDLVHVMPSEKDAAREMAKGWDSVTAKDEPSAWESVWPLVEVRGAVMGSAKEKDAELEPVPVIDAQLDAASAMAHAKEKVLALEPVVLDAALDAEKEHEIG